MQSVDIRGLELFDEELNKILKEFPDARRELHEEFAELLKEEVDTQVDASGIQDWRGRI